jgi:AbiV family abortive infection protein
MNRMKDKLIRSTQACLKNGRRLLDDVEFLDLQEPPATAYFLCMIAQEELAKAFLLALVVRGVIPWDRRLLRASRDHTCKQLLCLVMDYLSPDSEEFIDRRNAVVLRHEVRELPSKVIDAINILRHEKIGRWVEHSWVWAEDPDYDQEAVAVMEGKQDRLKQDALYVRLAADGGIASVPGSFTSEIVRGERERGDRLARLTEGVLEGEAHPAIDYDKVEELFPDSFCVDYDWGQA